MGGLCAGTLIAFVLIVVNQGTGVVAKECPDCARGGRCNIKTGKCECFGGFQGERCEQAFLDVLRGWFTLYQVFFCCLFGMVWLWNIQVIRNVVHHQGRILPITTRFTAIFLLAIANASRFALWAIDPHYQHGVLSKLLNQIVWRALFFPFLFGAYILITLSWAETLNKTTPNIKPFLTKYRGIFVSLHIVLFVIEVVVAVLTDISNFEALGISWQVYITVVALLDIFTSLYYGRKLYNVLIKFPDASPKRKMQIQKLRLFFRLLVILMVLVVGLTIWYLTGKPADKPGTWLGWHSCSRVLETMGMLTFIYLLNPGSPAPEIPTSEQDALLSGGSEET